MFEAHGFSGREVNAPCAFDTYKSTRARIRSLPITYVLNSYSSAAAKSLDLLRATRCDFRSDRAYGRMRVRTSVLRGFGSATSPSRRSRYNRDRVGSDDNHNADDPKHSD